jgi:type I restriction enzyme M protein
MPRSTSSRSARTRDNGATLGFEAKLWQAADALRNNMDAAEYKHVVLGLIFLKYISDAFEAKHAELDAQRGEGADPEDPDEYRAENIFWVPPEARWSHLKAAAPQPTIGQIVDEAMAAIERDNLSRESFLPKDYARPGLDKQRLGQLINLVSDIGLGGPADRARDILRRVYEYFLSQFASAEGKKGGQFYTPTHVVRVLVAMLAPYKGRVYDPCCGSGGMFVQSEKFIEAHSGRIGDISIYGQESNYTTWRLAKMNLAIRRIGARIEHGDSFHNDQHPDLKADYVLANPPFNDSDWRGELLRNDKRWVFGAPPAGNANFAWVQHFVHHLRRPARPFSCSPTARCRRTNRAKARSAKRSSRLTSSIAWWHSPASSSMRRRSRSVCGFSRATSATAASATAAARPCSSTRGSSARWSTASTAN